MIFLRFVQNETLKIQKHDDETQVFLNFDSKMMFNVLIINLQN